MSEAFTIKRVILEKQLQNLQIKDIYHTLDNINLSFAIELLSVKKNIQILSKKTDFNFLSQLFKKMNTLNKKSSHLQFLKTSNEYFTQEVKSNLLTNIPEFKFQNFIERVIDLSIFQNKQHSFEDIEKITHIAKTYDISNQKLVNWIGKICSKTNHPSLLNDVIKLSVLQQPGVKERFLSIVINMSKNIDVLDKLFSVYEYDIYATYANYKSEQKTWSCLLPNQGWQYAYLPYIDENKLNWLEDKKIGYKNNPVYFELYTLETLFKQSKYSPSSEEIFNIKMTEDYFQNIIYNSLKEYQKIYLPKKEEIIQKNLTLSYDKKENFSDWVNESPLRYILSVYDKNEVFYNFCQKISFKIYLEDKLVNNNKKEKKIKI